MDTANTTSTEGDAVIVGDEGDAFGQPFTLASRNVARMPVGRNSAYYNMNHKRRGMAIICNHEYFDSHSLKRRNGTNVDRDNLERNVQDLGFQVSVHDNLGRKT
jgi:caspase-like apoptosis-related cysteine protease